ncbi:MAG: excinuclease ABC subunit UvrC [Proteobacteria bacterium]|nr:excinuclease ABC subunit UvrC [Pseudomonadota bacterium]NIS70835.1 excinuclease ABC subunit UvrC [Pseudomonadota bacterium]
MLREEKIKNLPPRPGVYLMKDRGGKILYVGKAKNLSHRLRSYFGRSEDSRFLVRFFVSKIEDVECIVTNTEKEALILENNLIKKFKPRYNVKLKDDKTYFNLKLDIQNPFPRLTLVRRVRNDGACYFGPFSSSRSVKETMNFIEKYFQLRRCADSNFKNRRRPCLYYQMGQCQGACVGLVDEKRYRERVREVILFLEGKKRQLIDILQRRMETASESLSFEESARLRDQIQSIEKTIEKQKIVSFRPVDQDVIALYREGALVEIHVLFVRQGKVMEGQSFSLSAQQVPNGEVISSFVKQFYAGGRLIPREILLPFEVEDRDAIAEWLTEQKGSKATVRIPRRGSSLGLLRMVEKNAEISFKGKQTREKNLGASLEELKKRLRLSRIPRRIECFDISNILGTAATGSMVVFQDGQPDKAQYRRFKIRSLSQPDDYGMMYEVLFRRYSKATHEDGLPDLIMVDGGKGHLQVVLEVFKDLNMKVGDAIALAKPRRLQGRSKGEERSGEKVYIPRIKDPIHMPKHSIATFLLQRIRDESHRFAISYHKKLRRKRDLRSILDDVPGVGKARKRQLLRQFRTLRQIQNASIEELQRASGIDRTTAGRVFQFFQGSEVRGQRAPK